MLASTASNPSGHSSPPIRFPTNLLAPRTSCDHNHGHGEADHHHARDTVSGDSLLPARIDRLALDNDTIDEYQALNETASPLTLTGTRFFSSLLLPSIVRLPPIPSAVDPPAVSGEPTDLQPYWALFKQVQSIRSTLNQHVIDRAFQTYAHDRPAYHAEFQQVMAQAMSTLSTVHGLLRSAGLLPPIGRDASAIPNMQVTEDWDLLCQHVGHVQELERERMAITVKWQELVAESLHGARDVQEEAEQVKRLRDGVVERINEALEEAQAWYAELTE